MKLTIVLTVICVVLLAALLKCRSSSLPLRAKAKQDAINAANAKKAEEEAARERTRRDNLKREVLQIVNDAVENKNSLNGLSAPYPHRPNGFRSLAAFIDRVGYSAANGDDLSFWKNRSAAHAEQLKNVQAQLKEIQKALRMGQPIE